MSQITTCIRCHSRIQIPDGATEQRTLLCPRCLGAVDNPLASARSSISGINTDVRRELSVGSIVLGVLIGLCVLGIIVASARTRDFQGPYAGVGRAFILMFFFFALDIVVSIACILALVRWGTAGVRRVSAGRVVGLTFLSLASVVAVVIFFFMTCLGLVSMK